MSESAGTVSLAKAIVVMAVGGLVVQAALDTGGIPFAISARGGAGERGEYGGDLGFLRRFHVGPRSELESNHYFDLWSPGALPALARVNGLTNNHALIVDSHGGAGFLWHGRGYGLYPRETLVPRGQKTPCFSPADFAKVLGRENAAGIRNIVIAGCNGEGLFRSREWRRHFVNATNITYMTPGKLAYKPMFYQAIVTPSLEIKPLFGRESEASERSECIVQTNPSPGVEELGAYVADLYLDGARKPFRTQPAGRELLEPVRPAMTAVRTDLAPAWVRR